MTQEVIVAVVLVACVAYTVRRLWHRIRAARGGDVRCAGCPLADTCTHKGQHNHDSECHCHTAATTCDCCK